MPSQKLKGVCRESLKKYLNKKNMKTPQKFPQKTHSLQLFATLFTPTSSSSSFCSRKRPRSSFRDFVVIPGGRRYTVLRCFGCERKQSCFCLKVSIVFLWFNCIVSLVVSYCWFLVLLCLFVCLFVGFRTLSCGSSI